MKRRHAGVGLTLIAPLVFLGGASATPADEPYKRMLDDPLDFTGSETLATGGMTASEIVIGLFSPDGADDPVGRAIARGAALAVDQANAEGGAGGRPIRLVRRWADDPWGAGAIEVVRLVFEDHVWALIGGPDGASTHIAQQIATKAHIPLIAPVSSDPSLTHTRVPWIFRLPPDDAAQAALLVERGIIPRGLAKIGLVTSTDHDSRIAATELTAALQRAGVSPLFHIEVTPNAPVTAVLATRIAAFEPDGLVIRVPRADVRPVADALANAGIRVPLFLPWIPGLDVRQYPLADTELVVAVEPFAPPWVCGPALKLVRAFIARYGDAPAPAAVYGYDAVQLIVAGIRLGGEGRVALHDGLIAATPFTGASGPIAWDTGGGNRLAAASIVAR